MSILGAFGLSIAIDEDMVQEEGSVWSRKCRFASGGRVGVVCLCVPKAFDPNTHKQPLDVTTGLSAAHVRL